MKDVNKKILRAFRKRGVLESSMPSLFNTLVEQKVYDHLSGKAEITPLSEMSDEELTEWTEGVLGLGNFLMENDCFTGSDPFEKGNRLEERLCDYASRWRGHSHLRRMF